MIPLSSFPPILLRVKVAYVIPGVDSPRWFVSERSTGMAFEVPSTVLGGGEPSIGQNLDVLIQPAHSMNSYVVVSILDSDF